MQLGFYPATKYGSTATTEVMRMESVNKGNNKNRISSLSPGLVKTHISKQQNFHKNSFFGNNPCLSREYNDTQFISTFDDNLTDLGCHAKEKVAIIVHGWIESIDTPWVPELIANLREFRGGCIIFMMVNDYFILVQKFNPISIILLKKLRQLEEQGFDENEMFLFGFSFGAQLVIQAGMLFGNNRIAEIDACDPAGPGFVLLFELQPQLAAKNTQCIHTSSMKGTLKRNCHQDWLMGKCGRAQEAAGVFPRGSHGLCPKFYNAAFRHNFEATQNVYRCPSLRVASFPENFKMGYMERRKNKVFGDLFSPTSECYPYNNIQASSFERLNRLARRRRQRLSGPAICS
ncbi:hypothetical protein PVAND_004169 [Polypedilum vanderplanki]|uniref:Lipase domain-containing protein n=1 Tax=Polypedilum vanderplanki TaxID=319348 RepID=A0A9J6BWS2_POLVA|nr:hypothetical protein PVAND_004169 [Polypedilum vanderplanki]